MHSEFNVVCKDTRWNGSEIEHNISVCDQKDSRNICHFKINNTSRGSTHQKYIRLNFLLYTLPKKTKNKKQNTTKTGRKCIFCSFRCVVLFPRFFVVYFLYAYFHSFLERITIASLAFYDFFLWCHMKFIFSMHVYEFRKFKMKAKLWLVLKF